MYERQSRLSDRKRELLIEHFVASKTGRAAAELVGVHRNTAASFYTRLRKVIAEETEKEMESYFPIGGKIEVYVLNSLQLHCVSELLVFVLFKTDGKVYTEVLPNTRPATLKSITERLVKPDSVVYTDGYPEWDALDGSDFHHVRPKYLKEQLRDNDSLMGIYEFWFQSVSWVAKFHGIPKQSIHLFLKEFEWRYNGGDDRELLNQLKTWVALRYR